MQFNNPPASLHQQLSFADLFAGGGGTTTGAFNVPGLHVKWALNHDETAIKTHAAAHPETKHYQADIRTQDVHELEPVDILWASLECTEHSKAKGGKEKNIGSFTLGWELYRYLPVVDPLVLMIENVPEFIRWGELKDGKRVKGKEGCDYRAWVDTIKSLGYVNYEYRFLDAADFGQPTRRVRYFGIFAKAGIKINWPEQTHHKDEMNLFGLPKWVACRDFINLNNEGQSIFGRELNPNIPKNKRQPLSPNTLRRIAGGLKKFAPELYFIMKYYGNGDNCHSINQPLHTIRTKESHALIKVEKLQFIQDHCHTANYNSPAEPLNPQLTRQTKQLITVNHFISKYYGNLEGGNLHHCYPVDEPSRTITTANQQALITTKTYLSKYYNGQRKNGHEQHHCQGVDQPFPTIKTIDGTALITTKQFIASSYNSSGKPEANVSSIENPVGSITTDQKHQFITAYFNSSGHPETQNQSIDKPLNTILTAENKKALVTVTDQLFDFDIKMRFLDADELAAIMGFPEGYFKRGGLKLSKKAIIRMVGNAVHVKMAELLIQSVTKSINDFQKIKTA